MSLQIRDNESWYDTAQICINGHVVNALSEDSPNHNKKHCDECGAETINTCPSCNQPIRGHYHVPDVIGFGTYKKPLFCPDCGKPYPWAESKIKAARELSDELVGLSPDEKEKLKSSLDELIKKTPQTELAAFRFKTLTAKAGQFAIDAFKDLLKDVLDEQTKKTLWK